MDNKFLAKSIPVQTICEHTDFVLKAFDQLSKIRPNILCKKDWALLKIAILYHDIGKIDTKFQNMIYKALGWTQLHDKDKDAEAIPHNYLSCCFINSQKIIEKFGEDECELLYKTIFYHHDRIFTESVFRQYVKTCYIYDSEQFELHGIIVPDRLSSIVLDYYRFDNEYFTEAMRKRYILIKGILNRVDYAASAGIDEVEESCQDEFGNGLQQTVQALFEPTGNYQLRPVQKYMQENRDHNLVVTAATGIGKTEAALLWLGNDKSFYTLPLKVSINAIYERIVNDIGYKKAGLLHSDALSYHLQAQNKKSGGLQRQDENLFDEASHAYTCTHLLARPVTITTIDQLFKFVFRYNGGEMQLATLSYSRLVIDEIQMYSPELVAIILVALKMIAEMGGKFSIITATFPPVLYKLMDECWGKDQSWLPLRSPSFHSTIIKRHRIRLLKEKEFDYKNILQKAKTKKVLILANTVSRAEQIYINLQNEIGVSIHLLHASFMKKDRAILESDIKAFAPNDNNMRSIEGGIWISTQIVEASLDIDFDLLFTELCTIDSLLQRMGRIYRSRMYDLGDEPNVYILDGKNGYGTVIMQDLYEFSLASIIKHDGELLEESDEVDVKQIMIAEVYDPEINKAIWNSKYCHEIRQAVETISDLKMYELDSSDVRKRFRSIDTISVIPECIYRALETNGTVIQWQKKLNSKGINNGQKQIIKNEISQYTINLSYYTGEFAMLKQNKWLYGKYKIYLYIGKYDFDEVTHTGEGLKRERKKKNNPAIKDSAEIM